MANARGRVAAIIKGMRAADLTPEDVARIPEVVRRHAAYRVLDLPTVQTCWVWLVEPPANVGDPSPLQMVDAAKSLGGGRRPF